MPPITPALSFSTYWLSHRHRDGYALAKEIADLGFKYITISAGLRFELVTGLIKAVTEGWIAVDTVHNITPLSPGIRLSNYSHYQATSFLRSRRNHWIKLAQKTISFASDIGAHTVVIDLGEIPFYWINPLKKLKKMEDGRVPVELMQDIDYQRYLHKTLTKIKKRELRPLRHIRQCMYPILGTALDKKIKIGVQNPRKINQLPLEEDMRTFFNAFNLDKHVLGYWYNTGHGKIKEQMGLLKPVEHLKQMEDKLIGFACNDVSAEGRHRRPLGYGAVDFEELVPFMKPDLPASMELSRRTKPNEVIESREYFEDLF